jgi:hypothetical protein
MKVIILITLNLSILTQDCGVSPPKTVKDCSIRTYNSNKCCFLSNNDNKLCKLIDMPTYEYNPYQYNLNNTIYNMICSDPMETEYPGGFCGIPNPSNYTNCTNYSTTTNKCCYYNSTSLSACFLLGENYTAQIISLISESINANITCCSENVKGVYYILILLLIFNL